MSYATIEDVKSLFRDFADNADAAVNDAEISLFLDNTEAVINSAVGELYALPILQVDSPQSFKILKMIHMYKVACIVDDILNNYSEADKKPGWCKKAHDLLNAIAPLAKKNCKRCEPTMKLTDATYLKTDSQRGRVTISQGTEPTIKKGFDNW